MNAIIKQETNLSLNETIKAIESYTLYSFAEQRDSNIIRIMPEQDNGELYFIAVSEGVHTYSYSDKTPEETIEILKKFFNI